MTRQTHLLLLPLRCSQGVPPAQDCLHNILGRDGGTSSSNCCRLGGRRSSSAGAAAAACAADAALAPPALTVAAVLIFGRCATPVVCVEGVCDTNTRCCERRTRTHTLTLLKWEQLPCSSNPCLEGYQRACSLFPWDTQASQSATAEVCPLTTQLLAHWPRPQHLQGRRANLDQ